jgi:hypothetical protein
MLDPDPNSMNPDKKTVFRLGKNSKFVKFVVFCRDEDGEAATAGIVSVFSSAMALLRYRTPN